MFQEKLLLALKNPSFATFLLVFVFGMVFSMVSCVFLRIPILIGALSDTSGSKKHPLVFTLAFILGLVVTYVMYGLLLGFIGSLAKKILIWTIGLYYFLGIGLFFIGLYLLGLLPFHTFEFPDLINIFIKNRSDHVRIGGIILLGALVAFLETPACPSCGPIIFALSSYTVAHGNIGYGVALFSTYALGQSLVLLIAGFCAHSLKFLTPKVDIWEQRIRIISGVFLLYLGIYFIWLA